MKNIINEWYYESKNYEGENNNTLDNMKNRLIVEESREERIKILLEIESEINAELDDYGKEMFKKGMKHILKLALEIAS